MATNPMQKKARVSFILGMLVALLIAGIIIALLIMQLTNTQKKVQQLVGNKVRICVVNTDVKSGQIITEDLIKQLEVDKDTIPSNSFGNDVSNLSTYSLTDIAGNSLRTIKIRNDDGEVEAKLALPSLNKDGEIEIDEVTQEAKYRMIETIDGANYYYQSLKEAIPNVVVKQEENRAEIERDPKTQEIIYKVNNITNLGVNEENVKVELTSTPLVAKIDINNNTILTSSMIRKNDQKITDDVRKVEYNMIELPTQLEDGQYIDIRLRLPNGKDYIVTSHKIVEIPMIDGVPSLTNIWVNLGELEILNLSCAIIEAYKIEGSILYATEYVEPGLQTAAIATYIPDDETLLLMKNDPNCLQEAKNALFQRTRNEDGGESEEKQSVRNPINSGLRDNQEDALDNVKEKVTEEIRKRQEERQQYLESLGGVY